MAMPFRLGSLGGHRFSSAHEHPVAVDQFATEPALKRGERHAQHGKIKIVDVHDTVVQKNHAAPDSLPDDRCRERQPNPHVAMYAGGRVLGQWHPVHVVETRDHRRQAGDCGGEQRPHGGMAHRYDVKEQSNRVSGNNASGKCTRIGCRGFIGCRWAPQTGSASQSSGNREQVSAIRIDQPSLPTSHCGQPIPRRSAERKLACHHRGRIL